MRHEVRCELQREDYTRWPQVVSSVVQLQGALSLDKGRSRPLGVVCCIADPDTAKILSEVRMDKCSAPVNRKLTSAPP